MGWEDERVGIDRKRRWKGERQEGEGEGGRVGIDTGEWGGRGSVDRYDWEGRRRVGTDRGSGVGGGRELG